MDTRISILQYIKGGLISVDTEISNIKANLDVNVRIQKFLMKSIDYQELYNEINNKRKLLDIREISKNDLQISKELNLLLTLEKEFIIDTLNLADVFSKLDIRTKRLKKCVHLFNQGKFKEADALLIESELMDEQFNLLIQLEFLENRRDEFLDSSFNNLEI